MPQVAPTAHTRNTTNCPAISAEQKHCRTATPTTGKPCNIVRSPVWQRLTQRRSPENRHPGVDPHAVAVHTDSHPDRGAVTAEYAIVIMAAVAFAGLLVAIMGSPEVRELLVGLVQRALGSAG